ncbi:MULTISPECIES: haloacid dehalogenase-like hydrolase [Persicobacter]|nr:haloacid dehalogenase-like hydrolase [Persicobacter sp. CCB-QB2]
MQHFIPFAFGHKPSWSQDLFFLWKKKLYDFRLISENAYQRSLIKKYFKGINLFVLEEQCKRFFLKKSNLLFPENIRNKIKFHQLLDHQIIFISSLPKNLLYFWCREQSGLILANELEEKNELLTGNLKYNSLDDTLQMHWIKQKITPEYYSEVIVYSDKKENSKEWITYRRP